MSRPALFSYEGALRVLGKYDRPWLDKTDVLLGVGILVGGAVEPSLLDLVDPKNEATASVRKILDGITDKLTGLSGTHRHELIAAAHTIIAVTSVFDAFRAELGEDYLDQLKITDREKFRIFNTEPPGKKKEVSALPALTSISVPAPSATCGFQENLDGGLGEFLYHAVTAVVRFLHGLSNPSMLLGRELLVQAVTTRSRETYTHHYIGLGAAIPEFRFWALLSENAATRAAFSRDLAAIRTESLELFSQLLAKLSSGRVASQKYRRKLRILNAATLSRPLLGSDIDPSSIGAVFPTVEAGFVAPGYRLTVYSDETVASSQDWWRDYTDTRDDLDTFLAAYLAGVESTIVPLLVLGNPGAGKSLLMEVLAARLPTDRFTVVPVQLRQVRAQDRVQEQIESELRRAAGKSADWEQLAEECGDSVLVVLLDGFDELIQASGVHQSTYLQQVQEFQRHQALLGQPVAVVVTSRMLVADRARIPAGVPIVKLEEFDDARIERWLDTWNTTNETTSDFRPLTLDSLDHHVELARQPLLLLMLAIYAADPNQLPLNGPNLSNAELYRRLINSFVVRQVGQKGAEPIAQAIIEKRTAESLWQLGIAAFAMFNRGHQYVTAPQLNQDLAVFAPSRPATPTTTFDIPIDDADRTVENFFFIHSPKFKDGAPRTYEFLHATFGEFLVAEVTVKLLVQMAAVRAALTAIPGQPAAPDDSRLYALTCHQVLAERKPIIEFARGLFNAITPQEQEGVLALLDDLIRSFHDRARTDPGYTPVPTTVVSRVANYSANLVCLRALLRDEPPMPIDGLFRHDDDPLQAWRATVHLWQAGLKPEGWQSILDTITLVVADGAWYVVREEAGHPAPVEARLLGDPLLAGRLSTGGQFVSPDVTSDPREASLLRGMARWLILTSGSARTGRAIPYDTMLLSRILDDLDRGIGLNLVARARLASALSREACRLPGHIVERGLKHLIPKTLEECESTSVKTYELISAICAHPGLISGGIFRADLLATMFGHDQSSVAPSLVLTWATLNSAGSEVDESFQSFYALVEEAAEPSIEWISFSFMPVEVFEYLSQPRRVEPTIGASLLGSLQTIIDVAAHEVHPQTMLRLAERFHSSTSEARPQEEDLADFISRYLTSRGLADVPADLPALFEILRQMS